MSVSLGYVGAIDVIYLPILIKNIINRIIIKCKTRYEMFTRSRIFLNLIT